MLATKKRDTAFVSLAALLTLATFLCGCQPEGTRLLRAGEAHIREGRFDRAISVLSQAKDALADKPRACAQAWNHLGLAYHHAGQVQKAADAYTEALRRDRDLAVVHYNLGTLHLEQGNLPAAIERLTTYTVLQPKAMTGWLQLATAQWRARQIDAAERSVRQVLAVEPGNPEALNNLGLLQAQRRRPREAAQAFVSALRTQADYAPAVLNLAIVSHQQLNDRGGALQKYRHYLALDPTGPHSAAVEELTRQLGLELNPSQRAQVTNPPVAAASVTNKLLPASNVTAIAKATTNQAAPTLPSAAPTKQAVAAAKAPPAAPPPARPTSAQPLAPRPGEAPAPAEVVQVKTDGPAIVALDVPPEPIRPPTSPNPTTSATGPQVTMTNLPTAPESPEKKGGLLRKLNPVGWFGSKPPSPTSPAPAGKEPKSKAGATPLASPSTANASLSAQPTNTLVTRPQNSVRAPATAPTVQQPNFQPYVYRNLPKPQPGNRPAAGAVFRQASELHQQGRRAAAIEGYEEALRLDPASFEAAYNLGVAALETGDLPTALSASETAMSINPTALNARFNFALALQRANHPLDAAAELEKAAAANPREARVHLALGNLYTQELGEPARARPHYQKVLELEPQHAQAPTLRTWLSQAP